MAKEIKEVPTPGVFTRVYKDKQGRTHTWFFNNKKMDRGPFKVEIDYPADWKDEEEVNNKDLPITKQMFLNEANGKMVGYSRAVQLGIYKPEGAGGGRGRPKKA